MSEARKAIIPGKKAANEFMEAFKSSNEVSA